MTSSSATAAARRQFDQAMAVLEVDRDAAHRHFREATDADPSMADAWLGRVAVGDDGLATLQELYAYGSRLHRESNRLGSRPRRHRQKTGPYLSITVTGPPMRVSRWPARSSTASSSRRRKQF